MDDEIALTIKDVVRASKLSRTTIYAEIAARNLPSLKVGGRRLVLRQDLIRYLEALRDEATAGHPGSKNGDLGWGAKKPTRESGIGAQTASKGDHSLAEVTPARKP